MFQLDRSFGQSFLVKPARHLQLVPMGFGIKEPKLSTVVNVPGTSILYDRRDVEQLRPVQHAQPRHDEVGEIVLVPQPSPSPNDPLVSFSSRSFSSVT